MICQTAPMSWRLLIEALFEPDDLIELRFILPQRRGASSRFVRGPAGLAAEWSLVERQNATADCYFGACPRAVEGKEDRHVAICRAVFADFDDCEPGEAIFRIGQAGLPHPTATVWSGHGTHCYWRLEDPIEPGRFTDVQRRLALALGSDPVVHNPSRIMRLPGTLHVGKGDSAECCVEEVAGGVVAVGDIEAILPPLDRAPETARPASESDRSRGHAGPAAIFREGGRNAALTREAGRLRRLGLGADEITAALHAINRNRCRPPLDEREVSGIGDSVAKYATDGEVGAVAAPPEPYRPFPVRVLPAPVSSYIESASAAIGCDPAYLALPLIAGLASAVGGSYRIVLKRRWQEPAIVWGAIVGYSGTAKSPALDLALRPVRKRQHDAMLAHNEELKQHEVESEIHEKKRRAWRNNKNDDGPPPEEPGAPVPARCWTDDCTIEALEKLLGENPRGLLVIRDELAGWLRGFDRYASAGGGEVARWLEVFGGRALIVDRKGSGTNYVPQAIVSIIGGIQPETLRRALGQEHFENGLAARLLLVMPPRTARRWTEADVDPRVEADLEGLFDALYALKAQVGLDGDCNPRLVRLSAEAKQIWIEFFDRHGLEQVELDGALAAVWSKLEGYAARFALIIHMVRQYAAGGSFDADVDAESMRAAVELAEWFGAEARRIYGFLSQSEAELQQSRVYEWLRRRGGSATRRDVAKSLFKGSNDAAQQALDALAEAGLGWWQQSAPGPRGGRPTRIFHINPDTPKPETPSGNPDSEGFGSGVSGIGRDAETDAGE